ncbi:MCE family protein [Mycobacterium sp. DL99]|uniref:MCE family protein n=1 Tax=Mycobacterium sp. DL99 TaxID=2528957 RepID=UPI001080572E|nr:MCE family protein [Mycobacterium sp. DL99]
MKSMTERDPRAVGAVGLAALLLVTVGALNYDDLAIWTDRPYSAYFTEASGLAPGSPVQIAGYQVGEVTSVSLQQGRVVVDFTVSRDIRLGERTEAVIKTKTLLGSRILAVAPRGDGELVAPIPAERTAPAYELPQALGDVSAAISGLDTSQLNDSLVTLSQAFADTPADVAAAVDGVARFSTTLDKRDDELRGLLAHANSVTGVLAERSDQIVGLVHGTNALLNHLQTQSGAIDRISNDITALSQQLSGFVADNKDQLKPALDKLNGVLAMVDNNKDNMRKSIKLLSSYALSLGEAVSGGPFFKAYVANLVPGQLMQPFIDAAFSDLGLDPNVLLPSQLSDPPVGQQATPPLPIPYPRTGQGGEPNLTVPDAITGHLGDPRYPYSPPAPQPPPGGPPPGPPAGYDPATPDGTEPKPTTVDLIPPPPGPPQAGEAP